MENRELVVIQKRIEALELKVAAFDRHHTARPARLSSSHWLRLLSVAALISIPIAAYAATISVPNAFVNGTIADADEVNANFQALVVESNNQDSRISALETNLLAETQIRADGDAVLRMDLDAEEDARILLQYSLNLEVDQRNTADTALQQDIDTEEVDRIAADIDLDARVGIFDPAVEGNLDSRVDALEAP